MINAINELFGAIGACEMTVQSFEKASKASVWISTYSSVHPPQRRRRTSGTI